MRKEINVKFASEDDNGNVINSYWETISLEVADNANMEEVCECIYHHDRQIRSMEDFDAYVIDVEWQK